MSARHTKKESELNLLIPVVVLVALLLIGVGVMKTIGPVDITFDFDALKSEDPTGLADVDAEKAAQAQAEADAAAEAEAQGKMEALGQFVADEEPYVPLPTPSTAGALQVKGSQLVDAQGNPIQLRGISTHGLAWFPDFVNKRLFQELHDDWGVNVVRLALYPSDDGGFSTGGDREKLRKTLIKGIKYATAADLYVVVDWHTLSDSSPWWNMEDARQLLGEVSSQFADADNILYEVCNEPNSGTNWGTVKAYVNEMVPVIRENDPDAVIITGTPDWSQDLASASADPLEADNVMYSLHFYAATHQKELRDTLKKAVEDGLPVFVTEFGICEASGSGKVDYKSADAWVKLMDELNVSFICWNLSNKDESAALIKSGVKKTSGFTVEDLTDEGKWLVQVLKSPGFDRLAIGLQGADKKDNQQGAAMMVPSDGTMHFTAAVTNRWEQDGKTFYQYELQGTNYSAAVKTWLVTVPFNGTVTLEDYWNCSAVASGNRVMLKNADTNGKVAAGDTIDNIGFIVSGSENLAVIEEDSEKK